MYLKSREWISGLLVFVLWTASAQAGTVVFTNQHIDLQGGLGNVPTSLVLHANNQEFGSVLWNGTQDVLTGDTTNQSATRTVGELAGEGITAQRFFLFLNIAEPGNGTDILLHNFSMRFTDSTGAALFGDVSYIAPVGGLPLEQTGGGVSAEGWVFQILLTPGEATSFFGSNTNRVGMLITEDQAIQNTGGAPEVFFFSSVPEPASIVLLGMGMIAVVFTLWRRRVRHV